MGLDLPPAVDASEEVEAGTLIVGFDYKLPTSDESCRKQIAVNISRGDCPEAIRRRGITVIAGGPSACGADLFNTEGPTLALNSALALFTEWGLAPTYWACCDPQEVVASFIPDNPPIDTIYFVASKCHASVFEKLKNRDVRLWHVNDHPTPGLSHIPPSCSITLTAAWLMHRLGFTDFDFWGWDGCFIDGKHHATISTDWGDPGEGLHINYGGEIVDGEVVGGRTFATTRAWAAEAAGAGQFFQLAVYFDIGVNIHGDGMFKAAQESILNANKKQ